MSCPTGSRSPRRAGDERGRIRSMKAQHDCPLIPAPCTVRPAPRAERGAQGVEGQVRAPPSRPRPLRPGEIPVSEPNGRTKNARIVRSKSSQMSMTRNVAEITPLCAAGVGLPPGAEAGGEEWSIPESIASFCCQAGQWPHHANGPAGARSTAGPPWLAAPARHEPVRITAYIIIPLTKDQFNGWSSATPLLAPDVGRPWPVVGPQGPHRQPPPSRR
jgi:hypothetical protein